MIDLKKCIEFDKNCGGTLYVSAKNELDSHGDKEEYCCSGLFTKGLERRGLAKAPISSSELRELVRVLKAQ